MASRIAVMSEGRILQVGAPSDIYETPVTRFVADFIGNVNLMEGTLKVDSPDHVIIDCADCSHYVGHGITGTEGMNLAVAVRPEKIVLQRDEPQDAHHPHNRVRGTIRDLSYFGSFTVYHVALASGAVLKINMSNVARHRDDALTWGDTAWASWSPTAQVVLTQ
jgi:putrescine transport system ATP-binding protein